MTSHAVPPGALIERTDTPNPGTPGPATPGPGTLGTGGGGNSEAAHWHLVTYGLTELDQKESDDASISGWGFELTFRLAGLAEEPLWAVDLLTNLAGYVWTSAHPFAEGHHIDLRGPIRLGTSSPITAAAIVTDPVLGILDGPYGQVEFLQVVGLTADELELCRSWSTEGVLDLLRRENPLLVTDVDRPSLLGDPARRGEIDRRAASDGSALTELRVGTLSWRRKRRGVVVKLGAGAATALGSALRRELIAAGASFQMTGDAGEVRFLVAGEQSWRAESDQLEIGVPLTAVEGLSDLFTGRVGMGRPPGYRGLRFHVVP